MNVGPNSLPRLIDNALQLLKALIATPSMSREEGPTAELIATYLRLHGITSKRVGHNVWAQNRHFDPRKPTLLLNSHHDTVKPNASYTRDPFAPTIEDGKLYGLGSNDAGGCLVSLLGTFVHFHDRADLAYNLVIAASAEEEISGRGGIELLLPHLPPIDVALVGEPTQMHLAIAEKGLMVLDCTVRGRAGHAARDEGENAITKAMPDLQWFQTYQYPNVSPLLGPVKQSVTIIQSGTQHNVVPDTCTFTVDVRVTEQYTLEEVLDIVRTNVQAEVVPRSVRLRSSGIAVEHPLVQAGLALGRTTYGSPTLSDQALLPMPSLKCGPGHSERSHTADEFIYLIELEEGIAGYVTMLEGLVLR
ncbi:M20 family metallo-hydrolase [Fibrella forsythiae]|uniref:M20 family metallo-hydrolase n=1 Tax=Fibrella forsythiae TaxID=2817061 RepID=A0ABS3JCV9_9BACT|nr:M20 family metallo-hydrolase [Fibrella forsythiae]MBO0947843.1 M20 family metallo-hydrolase [Fibrella forsythiae]